MAVKNLNTCPVVLTPVFHFLSYYMPPPQKKKSRFTLRMEKKELLAMRYFYQFNKHCLEFSCRPSQAMKKKKEKTATSFHSQTRNLFKNLIIHFTN